MFGMDEAPDFVTAFVYAIACVTISVWLVRHLVRAWRRKRPTGFAGRRELAEVGVLALAFYLLLSLAVPVFLAVVAPTQEGNLSSDFTLRVAMTALANLLAIAIAFLLGRQRHRITLGDIGLRLPSPLAFAYAAGVFVAMAPAFIGVAALNELVVKALGWDVYQQTVRALLSDESFREHPFTPILIIAVVPCVEELLFRGIVQGALRAAFGSGAAIVAATLLFALVHDVQSSLPVFVVGVALGIVYETTGSILPCVMMHAAFNGFMVYSIHQLTDRLGGG